MSQEMASSRRTLHRKVVSCKGLDAMMRGAFAGNVEIALILMICEPPGIASAPALTFASKAFAL